MNKQHKLTSFSRSHDNGGITKNSATFLVDKGANFVMRYKEITLHYISHNKSIMIQNCSDYNFYLKNLQNIVDIVVSDNNNIIFVYKRKKLRLG